MAWLSDYLEMDSCPHCGKAHPTLQRDKHGLINTKESVHAGTRKSFLAAWRKEGKNIPEFINVKFWNHVNLNKAEIKRMVDNE